jgi:hypothetical protein
MNSTSSLLARIRLWRVVWRIGLLVFTAATATAGNIQTNWVERWITNTVEVQMQANRFVTEFHTNWVHQVKTNVLDLYVTNRVTKTSTNYLDVYTTNFVTKTLTNHLIVEAVQTNFVHAYKTNLHTLNLTNWNTVLLFRTNWVSQPVTNMVDIEMARQSAGENAPKTATPEATAASTADDSTEPLAIQATRSPRPPANNQVEVLLSVKWANNASTPLRVQQWRIEREDGSILSFGDEREFKRPLPVGAYKIQVRVQRDSRDTVTVGRATLTITPHEVLVAQKPSIRRSSS